MSKPLLGEVYLPPTPLHLGPLAAKVGPESSIRTLYVYWDHILTLRDQILPRGVQCNFGPLLPTLKFKRLGYGPNSSIRTLYVNWVQFCFILESISELVPHFGPRGPCLQSISILLPRIWFHIPHPSDGENMAKTMPFRRQNDDFQMVLGFRRSSSGTLYFAPLLQCMDT